MSEDFKDQNTHTGEPVVDAVVEPVVEVVDAVVEPVVEAVPIQQQYVAPQQPQYNQQQYVAPQQQQYNGQQPYAVPADTGSFGWAVLGFFIPLVGLILFLVWKTDKPLSAKKAGMGALVSVIVYIVFYVLMIILAVGFSNSYYSIAPFLPFL